MSAADSLADGDGLAVYHDDALVSFPPGFPLLLAALAEIFGVSAVTAARVANAVILGLIVVAAWLVLRRLASSAAIRVAGVLLVAAATTLHTDSSRVWSEPLFVLLTLLALLALNEAMRQPDRRGLARGGGARGVELLLHPLHRGGRHCQWMRRPTRVGGSSQVAAAARAAAFAVIAGAGPAAWIVRNLSVSDTVSGERASEARSFVQNAEDAVDGLGALVAPSAVSVREVVLVLLCAVIVAALFQLRATGLGGARRFVWLLAAFVALYVVVVVVISSTTQVDPLTDRLLSPVFVPLVGLGVAVLDRATVRWRERGGPYLALLAPGALLLCAAGLAWGTAEAGRVTADGFGYAAPRWRDSDLAATVERAKLPPTVYSNVPDALFLLTSIDARCWPEELVMGGYCSGFPPPRTDLTDLERQIGTEPVALIWFTPDRAGQGPTPEIPAGLRVTRMTDTTDGSLYLLEPAG